MIPRLTVPDRTHPVALTAEFVAASTGGTLVTGDPATVFAGVSIDSRQVAPSELFVAIPGERFDGHSFVSAACARGATGVLVEPGRIPPGGHGGGVLIVVPDTIRALQALAGHVRRTVGSVVIGVTGSAGKTTTKELAADLLSVCGDVYRSHGNFNNHIGLPLSLLRLRTAPPLAVVELGMNHAGELSVLTAMARPDVRVWTNVAPVHAEFFPSLDAIADAKAEILEGATPETVVVANAADPRVMVRVRRSPARIVTFAIEDEADVVAHDVVDRGVFGTQATLVMGGTQVLLLLPLVGRGHLANALAAAAVARVFGVSPAAIADRLARATPAARRGVVHRLARGITLIDDSYNSNPAALEAMLRAVAQTPVAAPRVAILGEMLELGEQAVALHRACGRVAAAAGMTTLVAVGGDAARALVDGAREGGMAGSSTRHVESAAEFEASIATVVPDGALVLVKGSRGVRMDVLVDRLMADVGDRADARRLG